MRNNNLVPHTGVRLRAHRIAAFMMMALLSVSALSLSAAVHSQPATSAGTVIEVKFRTGRVRLRDGVPVDVAQPALANAQSAARLRRIGSWSRAHSVAEGDLDLLRDRAMRTSGQEVPDLNLYFRVLLPPGADSNQALRELKQMPNVAGAYLVPKPAPLPTAPDFSSALFSPLAYQRYLDAAPDGIGARDVSALKGANAANIAICDVEYSWNTAHTDLPTVTIRGAAVTDPFQINDPNSDNHGTAVIGVLGAKNNGSGTTGIAAGASISFAGAQTVDGYNVGAAIIACASALAPGDVIIIEQQSYGPHSNGIGCTGCVPVEWYKPTYDAISVAVASGIVVVEAAANGAENLDDPIYATGNDGHYPFLPGNDSGAILVGAGQSAFSGALAHLPNGFSNYGATVDLQGWGDNVTTSGYGGLYSAEGKNSWFTAGFNGTSSASPIVTGAVAVVQGVYQARFGAPATPAKIRALLQSTGTPQLGANHIGPLPNLRCALDSLLPLKLEGASTAILGTSAPVTGTITAADVTLPLTYTWQIDNGVPITVAGDLSSVFDPMWATLGPHTVSLQVRSGCGEPVSKSMAVEVARVSPTSAVIDGSLRVTLGSTASYTATIAPIDAYQPITYTWQVEKQPKIIHTAGLSDTFTATWNITGSHTFTTTITNGWGTPLVVTNTVVVGTPVSQATLDGPDTATLGATSSFTATVNSPDTTLPVSYTWQLDDSSPVRHSGDLTDTFAITWNMTGTHILTTTLTNRFGTPLVMTNTIDVGVSILVATLDGPDSAPLGATSSFTATVSPTDTTLPVSYTWQLDDDPPVRHSGDLSDTFTVTWNITGTHILMTTISNGFGTPYVISATITVNPLILQAGLEGPRTPTVGETSNYTITVKTLAANLPISYTWQLDDDSPVSHGGGARTTFAVHWLRDGPHVLRITIAVGTSVPFHIEQTIAVAKRNYPIYLPQIRR